MAGKVSCLFSTSLITLSAKTFGWCPFHPPHTTNIFLFSNDWLKLRLFDKIKIRKKLKLPYHSLAKSIKQSVKGAINFISDFEKNAESLTKQKGYDVAVCGHVHQPKISENYMNSGDFCENSTCLVEDYDGKWSIITIK